MTADFRDRLARRAGDAGIYLTALELDRLEQYWDLLRKWNATINLTSLPLRGVPDQTLDRLFIEPLAATVLVSAAPMRWYDLGSGGGSPAIPLKVMRPMAQLTMVESRLRKVAFLREVVRRLGFEGTWIEAQRFEEISGSDLHNQADLVTVRAVRVDRRLADACSNLLRANGRLLLFAAVDRVIDVPRFRLERSVRAGIGTVAVHAYVPRGTS